MANNDQLTRLREGVNNWNKWRKENPNENIDLREADLREANLREVDLGEADLREAYLRGADLGEVNLMRANLIEANLNEAGLARANLIRANLWRADLMGAKLIRANLNDANLREANLRDANLREANLKDVNLREANLRDTDLREANLVGANLVRADLGGANITDTNLSKADLSRASLVEANLARAKLTGSRIYGISAWGLKLDDKTEQRDLIITPDYQTTVTVDNIEVAQFVYLLLHNEKIRGAIDTIAKKAVLILGRFTPERKIVLDKLRAELRNRDYLPILFDFEKSTEKDLTETIKILAGMSLFVIADISSPKSSPLELQATVPDYSVPFVPIIQEGEKPFAMFRDLQKYEWVLQTRIYKSSDNLIKNLDNAIIKPALQEHNRLVKEKARKQIFLNVDNIEHKTNDLADKTDPKAA